MALASMMPTDPLSTFARINKSTYLYKPPVKKSNTADGVEPGAIVMLSWGQAPAKNIVKYTNRYKSLYPTSRILLIKTPFSDMILHTETSQKDILDPAVTILSRISNPRLLVHTFSNGGTYKLCELAKAYQRTNKTILPIKALIFDSAPGKPQFRRSVEALKHVLPKPWYLYFPALAVLYIYLASLHVMYWTIGGAPISTQVWHGANDSKLIDAKAERLYVFSKEDEMIWWEDVMEHATDAREKGWKVAMEEFSGSKHVAHVVVDPERYWDAITGFWKRSQPPKLAIASRSH